MKTRRRIGIVAALSSVLLASCNAAPLVVPTPATKVEETINFAGVQKPALDILFVIDNSRSMIEEQEHLAAEFPELLGVLRRLPNGLPDLRLAVVSTDLGAPGACPDPDGAGDRGLFAGDRARFQTHDSDGRDCGLRQQGAEQSFWLSAVDGGTVTNLVPGQTLEGAFSCMAARGIAGCGLEHQLAAMRLALNPDTNHNALQNANFLRPDAYLAIVVITDEDDCSVDRTPVGTASAFFTPRPADQEVSLRCALAGHACRGRAVEARVDSFALSECEARTDGAPLVGVQAIIDNLRALKRDPQKLLVAAIAGWPADGNAAGATYRIVQKPATMTSPALFDLGFVCDTGLGKAAPALRIKKVIDGFGANGVMTSICADDLRPALRQIATAIDELIKPDMCLEAPPADRDRSTPQLDPECVVTISDRAADREQSLPRCGKGPRPCWSVVPAAQCMTSGHRIVIERDGPDPQEFDTHVACATCARPDDPACMR